MPVMPTFISDVPIRRIDLEDEKKDTNPQKVKKTKRKLSYLTQFIHHYCTLIHYFELTVDLIIINITQNIDDVGWRRTLFKDMVQVVGEKRNTSFSSISEMKLKSKDEVEEYEFDRKTACDGEYLKKNGWNKRSQQFFCTLL